MTFFWYDPPEFPDDSSETDTTNTGVNYPKGKQTRDQRNGHLVFSDFSTFPNILGYRGNTIVNFSNNTDNLIPHKMPNSAMIN